MANTENIQDKIKLEPYPDDENDDIVLLDLLNQSLQENANTDNVPEHDISQEPERKLIKDEIDDKTNSTLNCPESVMVKIESNSKRYACDQCGKSFSRKYARDEHLILHTDNYFKCDVCDKKFRSKNRFREHIKIHSENMSLKCEPCGKEFQTQLSYKYHMESHEAVPKYKCHLCGKEYSNRYGLDGHRRVHRKKTKVSKPIIEQSCEICHRIVRTCNPRGLKIHMARHKIDRSHKCDECGKKFKCKTSFNKHVKMHDGIFDVQCDICSKHFTSKSSLRDHMISVHSVYKPYSCEFCGNRFSTRSGWYRHGEIHAKKNPFTCTVCDKKFGYPSHLKGHLKASHGIVEVTEIKTEPDQLIKENFDEDTVKDEGLDPIKEESVVEDFKIHIDE